MREQKWSEESQWKSENRFPSVAYVGKMYAYEWDVATDVIIRSGNIPGVLGSTGAASLTRQQLLARIHPDDRTRFSASVTERTPESPHVQISYRILCPDGSVTWVEKTAHSFFDEDGRLVRMIGMVADITERKRAEDALRESEMRYRRIVETTNEGVWLLDSKLCTAYVNQQMAEMLGYEPKEMIGRSVLDFYFPEDVERKKEVLNRRRQGVREQVEERLRRKDGSELWVRLAATPVFRDDGEFDGALAMESDITQRKRAEQALRESEERFRLAAQAGSMFAYSWDATTDVIERSGESAKILGLDEATSLTGRQAIGGVYPDDREGLQMAMAQLSPEQPFLRSSYRIVRPDESVVWVERQSRAYFDECGNIKRIIGMIIDITNRKRAEEAIKESEQRFRLVADTAPVMIWMSGPDKRPTYFNRAWLNFTGQSESDLLNGLAGIVHPDDYPKCHDVYCRGFDERQPFSKQCRLRRHDGQYRWILDIAVPRFHEDGSFAGYIGSCVDITEQTLAEEARALMSRRLIEVQDQERRLVARELHDDIIQRISLVAFNLKSLEQNLPSSPAILQERLAEEYAQVSELASDIDALSRRLHSATLQRLGLSKAAAIFCREFSQREKLQAEFSTDGTLEGIPDAISLCLHRVLQEALHNAAKHSGANQIAVQLVEKCGEIHLIVSDSGKGFDVESALRSRGLGLTSMQERVRLVSGTISIDSRPQAGTTIHVRVPLRTKRSAQTASGRGA